jgi:hypothetical protein
MCQVSEKLLTQIMKKRLFAFQGWITEISKSNPDENEITVEVEIGFSHATYLKLQLVGIEPVVPMPALHLGSGRSVLDGDWLYPTHTSPS